jgi:hypothetical protein
MGWASLPYRKCFIIAGLYWLLSCAMPRQGVRVHIYQPYPASRIGLMASFMISFTAISWTGVCADWAIKYAIVEFFASLGIVTGGQNWFAIAET